MKFKMPNLNVQKETSAPQNKTNVIEAKKTRLQKLQEILDQYEAQSHVGGLNKAGLYKVALLQTMLPEGVVDPEKVKHELKALGGEFDEQAYKEAVELIQDLSGSNQQEQQAA